MDLTQSLIEMTKAAQARRVASKQLEEATDMIACKIAEEGRSGDAVTVGGSTYRIETLVYGCSQWANMSWEILNRSKTLTRNGAVLADTREAKHDGSNLHYPRTKFYDSEPVEGGQSLPWAGNETRKAFAAEAAEVMRLFAVAWSAQAETAAQAAESVTKLAIR
jgi:hypothetical protein